MIQPCSPSKLRASRPMRWLLATTLLSLCIGCGEDDARPPSQNVTDMGGNGDMMTTPDGMMQPDADPVPARIELTLDPRQVAYSSGSKIAPVARAFDRANAPLASAPFQWTATPANAATREPGSGEWTLLEEGEVVIEACTVWLGPEGAPLCDQIAVLVNDGGPKIVITKPAPGAMLGGQGDAANTIEIEGQVLDSFGSLDAFVNNRRVELDAEGRFKTQIEARFGVNPVTVSATDGISRVASRAELDVLWAPSYSPVTEGADAVSATLDDGLVLRLGQLFIDDRRSPLTSPEGAAFTEDLADILILLLRNVDLKPLLPPLASGDIQIDIVDATLGNPNLRMDITSDGLELFIQSDDLSLQTSGSLTLLDETLDLTGTIEVGVSIIARAKITKESAAVPFSVQIEELNVAIERADSQFVSDDANAIFALAASALRVQLEALLRQGLEDSFMDAIPAVLEDALNSLDGALANQTFDLDVGLGSGPIDVGFEGAIDEVRLDPLRALLAEVKIVLSALAAPIHSSPGIALMSEVAQVAPEFLDGGRIQIAVRLATLNSLLHNLWAVGLLDLDVSTILPPDLAPIVQDATISGSLPPLLAPPTKGEPYNLMLYVGQLELDATLIGQRVRYGISMSAGLNASIANDALTIDIAPMPELRTWIISVEPEGAAPRINAAALRSLLITQLWPQLTAALGQGLSLPLPVLDLSALGTYAPPLASFTLTFDQARDVEVRREFLLLDARLRGTLPPPGP